MKFSVGRKGEDELSSFNITWFLYPSPTHAAVEIQLPHQEEVIILVHTDTKNLNNKIWHSLNTCYIPRIRLGIDM